MSEMVRTRSLTQKWAGNPTDALRGVIPLYDQSAGGSSHQPPGVGFAENPLCRHCRFLHRGPLNHAANRVLQQPAVPETGIDTASAEHLAKERTRNICVRVWKGKGAIGDAEPAFDEINALECLTELFLERQLAIAGMVDAVGANGMAGLQQAADLGSFEVRPNTDRKSTRLNSSHI